MRSFLLMEKHVPPSASSCSRRAFRLILPWIRQSSVIPAEFRMIETAFLWATRSMLLWVTAALLLPEQWFVAKRHTKRDASMRTHKLWRTPVSSGVEGYLGIDLNDSRDKSWKHANFYKEDFGNELKVWINDTHEKDTKLFALRHSAALISISFFDFILVIGRQTKASDFPPFSYFNR